MLKIIKNKIKFKNMQKGFSLLEVLVYVAIMGMFVFALVSFLNMMTYSRINNQTVLEVNNQGEQIIKTVTQAIRNSSMINSPTEASSSGTLSLANIISGNNPNIFNETAGVLYVQEGAGSPIALTNDKVSVSNLTFSNLSRPLTPGTIQVRFTLTSTNINPNVPIKIVDFYGSASIRK